MMPLLPQICEHETVRSYVRRTLVVNAQSGDTAAVTRFLYDEIRSHGVHSTMPHCLSRIVTFLEQACGSAEAVLHRHTLFDYYFAFAPTSIRRNCQSRLLGPCRGPRIPSRFRACFPLPPSAVAICPVCEQRSQAEAGFGVERRIHLMPFQQFCPVHGVLLQYVPERPTLLSSSRRDRLDRNRVALQQAYEARSLEYVSSVPDAACGCLYRKLMEKGYVTAGGHLRRSELVRGMRAFFGSGFVDSRLTELLRDGDFVGSFLDAWRRGDRVPSAVAGTLLNWYLTETAPLIERNSSRPFAACVAGDMRVLPNFSEYPSIRSAACAAGLKYATALNRAVLAGYAVSLRPKKFCADQQALATRLLLSGLTREAVAKKCGVSVTTIHRLCARTMVAVERRKQVHEERGRVARERWLTIHTASPTMSRTDIRRLIAADWA